MPRETIIKCSHCGEVKNDRINHWLIGSVMTGEDARIVLEQWNEYGSLAVAKDQCGNFEVCSNPQCLAAEVRKRLFKEVRS